MDVKNKVVIVTGAGSGIGKATAIHFAKHGAKVVVSDINLESAQKVVDEIVQEPLGGAQKDYDATSDNLYNTIKKHLDELNELDEAAIREQRYQRFRAIGSYIEG